MLDETDKMILKVIEENPSILSQRDIGQKIKIAKTTVGERCTRLQNEGYIQSTAVKLGQSSNYTLTEKGWKEIKKEASLEESKPKEQEERKIEIIKTGEEQEKQEEIPEAETSDITFVYCTDEGIYAFHPEKGFLRLIEESGIRALAVVGGDLIYAQGKRLKTLEGDEGIPYYLSRDFLPKLGTVRSLNVFEDSKKGIDGRSIYSRLLITTDKGVYKVSCPMCAEAHGELADAQDFCNVVYRGDAVSSVMIEDAIYHCNKLGVYRTSTGQRIYKGDVIAIANVDDELYHIERETYEMETERRKYQPLKFKIKKTFFADLNPIVTYVDEEDESTVLVNVYSHGGKILETLTGANGKLYYSLGDTICEYNLRTNEGRRLSIPSKSNVHAIALVPILTIDGWIKDLHIIR